jgi:serine/threonine protein kinase
MLSETGLDLLNKLLTYDPAKRITARKALRHAWFYELPLPKRSEDMPSFPSAHDAQKHNVRRCAVRRMRILPVVDSSSCSVESPRGLRTSRTRALA